MAHHPIITFDYDFSPYGRKVRSILAGSGIPFQRSDQPVVLPRPILEKLDITYRRIPLLAVGKDIYADTSLIIDVLQSTFHGLPTTPADKAYEVFGIGIFTSALNIIPTAALTPKFINDRESIFPVLGNPEYAELRPSGLAELKAKFLIIENDFLSASSGPFIAGERFGLADLHAGWAVGWALESIGLKQEPGFTESEFPRIYKWVASWPKAEYKDLGEQDIRNKLNSASYSAQDIGVNDKDPLGIRAGTDVTVENSDTKPGAHPQKGKLVGLNDMETVVELKNGLRLHFPRMGYIVKEAKSGGLASRFCL